MNIALIIAGGSGQRTHQDIPKQFINVFDRPVIIYTLKAFQDHPDVDSIAVVCLKGWEEILRAYAKQFNISKLQMIVPGGSNGQESIRNGVLALSERFNNDDIILVHDAIRPMVSSEIISEISPNANYTVQQSLLFLATRLCLKPLIGVLPILVMTVIG